MHSQDLLRAYWTNARGERRWLQSCTGLVVELAPALELEINLVKNPLFPEQVTIAAPPNARAETHRAATIVDMLSVFPISGTALRLGIDRRKERP